MGLEAARRMLNAQGDIRSHRAGVVQAGAELLCSLSRARFCLCFLFLPDRSLGAFPSPSVAAPFPALLQALFLFSCFPSCVLASLFQSLCI